ncbi:MAG: hypothetical protein LBO66_05850 [Deltaproteobacteria bacterium]|nr:hypothetical protein [Deltaproteobacteria bacterium]
MLKNLKPISTARVSFMSFKGEEAASFDLNPDLTPLQIEAYRLLEKIPTRP